MEVRALTGLKRIKQWLQKLQVAVESEGSQRIQCQEHQPDSSEFQEAHGDNKSHGDLPEGETETIKVSTNYNS
jgi:hypothetical protein